MNGSEEREAGSLALEFTLVAPALLLLVALLLAYGRAGLVSAALDSGVRDAARSATQARSADDARSRAEEVVRAAVGEGECADTLAVEPLARFEPGSPVTVTARCRYALADLGLPGAPGHVTVGSSFSSPLDPNRGVR
ncbi:TadE/TadG family type IV pilus assembly protein [Kineococcus sp. G2]|uniref:TadE/TadG family type IV pilus assembly protein n=1 Tax=Kineococcus sp. G2 TaxID=3127484 RepID=UPI00301D2433